MELTRRKTGRRAVRLLRMVLAAMLGVTSSLSGLLPGGVTPARAATYTVTSAEDDGAGSLRAVLAASASGDVIVFDAALAGQTITLASTGLVISHSLTIDAQDAPGLKVSGGDLLRVFEIRSPAVVRFSDFSVTHGRSDGVSSVGYGGGVWVKNGATLLADGMAFSASYASDYGGALYNAGVVVISDTQVVSNTSDFNGGGIFNAGSLALYRSTLSGNQAPNGQGGGLYNGSSTELENVTLEGNSALDGGGGLYNDGALTLRNVTLANNQADSGGGLYQAAGKTASMVDTLIAGSQGGDCASLGTFTANQNNLVQDGSCSAALSGDPLLAELGDYGGATPTAALLRGSPAIDAGENASCAAEDQRGVVRPVYGGSSLTCDIGAYEYERAPLMKVLGNAVLIPDAQLTPRTLDGTDFGSAEVGRLPITHTFTISNAGDLDLNLSGTPPVSLGGDHPEAFSVALQPGTAITPSGWLTFSVVFRPAALGALKALVSIANDDPNQNPYTFAIQGTGSCFDSITVTSSGNSGADTLRQALLDACSLGKIHLDAGLTGATIDLTSGALSVVKSVTIDADDAPGLRVSGKSGQRVFDIKSPAAAELRGFAVVSGTLQGGASCPTYCGGGIYVYPGASLLLERMLLRGNLASGSGGGVLSAGKLTLLNTTVAENRAAAGAGVYASGALTVTHSTVAYNLAANTIGGLYAYTGSSLRLRNSLLADNSNGDCQARGSFVENAANLAADGTCSAALSGPARLAELDDYGGNVLTYALLPGSPAVDAGAAASCAEVDGRGVSRPQGTACDLGAFESGGFRWTGMGGDGQAANVGAAYTRSLTVSLEALLAGEPLGPGGLISFTAPISGAGLSSSVLTATTSITGLAWLSVTANSSPGVYSVTAQARGIAAVQEFSLTNLEIPIAGAWLESLSPRLLGQTSVFTSGVAAGSNVGYSWEFGDGEGGSGAQISHTYQAVGVYPVTLTLTNTVSQAVLTGSMTIQDVAISGLSVQVNSPIQVDQELVFTPSVQAGTNVAYAWDFGDGAQGSGAPLPHLYPAVGEYTLTLTATNGVGQVAVGTLISVTDIPIQSLQVESNGVQQLGSQSVYTASVGAGTNVQYSWQFGDGGSAAGSQVGHTFAAVGTYPVTLTVQNGMGTQVSLTQTVIVDIPISGARLDVSSPTVLGSSMSFTASIAAGTNTLYRLEFGDGAAVTGFAAGEVVSHTYAWIGPYFATLVISNSASQQVVQRRVWVVDAIIGGLEAQASSPVELGQAAVFQASTLEGTNVVYDWDFGDGFVDSGMAVSHTYSTAGVYRYTLTAVNLRGAARVSGQVEVKDVPIQGLDLWAPGGEVWIGEGLVWYAWVEAGSNVMYTWDFGDGEHGQGQQVTHAYRRPGRYLVRLAAGNQAGQAVETRWVEVAAVPLWLPYILTRQDR
jgi:PKD repeat protein